jgi:hypothetical protein
VNYWLNIVHLLENKNNQEKIFFSLKLKVIKEEKNQFLEISRISLLIEAVAEVVVKVEVIAILINKIFKVILPIIIHSQEEAKNSVK